MKLYLLTTLEGYDYDEYNAFVVRAESEAEARRLASERNDSIDFRLPDNGRFADPTRSLCTEITGAGPAEIICASFNAG